MCEHTGVIRLKTPILAEHNRDKPMSACVWASTSVRLHQTFAWKVRIAKKKVFTASFHTFDAKQTSLILFNKERYDLRVKSWVLREIFVRNTIEAETINTLVLYYCITSWRLLHFKNSHVLTGILVCACQWINIVFFRVVTRRVFSTRKWKRSLKVITKADSNKIIKILKPLTSPPLDSISNNC